MRKPRARGQIEWREPGRKGGRRWARLLSHSGLNTEVMGPPCVWQAPAGVRQGQSTSRESVAGLRPHTTNTSPSAKPGCPKMGIRELRVNLAASCLHHAGRGGVVSIEKHLFSPVLFPPSHPHPPPRARQICSALALSQLQTHVNWPGWG